MFGKRVPPLSVVGVRTTWGPEVAPLLEPGEAVQVIVPARTGEARTLGTLKAMPWWSTHTFEAGRHALLVATDRAWLTIVRPERATDALEPGSRCDRGIRLAVSPLKQFDLLDRPYSIDPMWTDHVRAANEAADAREQGRAWDLDGCGDWVREDPKKTRGLLRSAFKLG
jgi:hypothetical protein